MVASIAERRSNAGSPASATGAPQPPLDLAHLHGPAALPAPLRDRHGIGDRDLVTSGALDPNAVTMADIIAQAIQPFAAHESLP